MVVSQLVSLDIGLHWGPRCGYEGGPCTEWGVLVLVVPVFRQ